MYRMKTLNMLFINENISLLNLNMIFIGIDPESNFTFKKTIFFKLYNLTLTQLQYFIITMIPLTWHVHFHNVNIIVTSLFRYSVLHIT